MSYLLSQMFFCLIIAFLCGLVLGYLLCKIFCKCNKKDEIEAQTKPSSTSLTGATTGLMAAGTGAATSTLTATHDTVAKTAAVATDTGGAAISSVAAAVPAVDTVEASEVINLDTSIDLDSDGYAIETLEGIGPKTGQMFRDYGIATVGDYLRKLYSHEAREQAAKDLEIRVKPVHEWASMSDLLRVQGIDHQYAELAFASGIQTVGQLASSNASDLADKMEATNKAGKQLIAPQAPSSDEVTHWVDVAKNMSIVVRVA